MAKSKVFLIELTKTQFESFIESLGEPSYRVKQIHNWVYRRLANTFEEMSDLPQALRQRLAEEARLHILTPSHEAMGHDGTVKTLFTLSDGKTIESTLMSYPVSSGRKRHTICISTQVGCPIGCPFCATGQQGFERNLTPGEIIDQVLYFSRNLREKCGEEHGDGNEAASTVTNLVFMGMGEPLVNYENVLAATKTLNSPEAVGLGARSMVVSTAGLVPQIRRLSQEKIQLGLAVSLHASNNALRDRLVPINRRYPLEELIPACRHFFEETGRRVSFEYILFDGTNDSKQEARSLAYLLAGLNCHVNLIMANNTSGHTFRPSPKSVVLSFEEELKRLHITTTLRQSRGRDIEAGCGQLRSRFWQAGHVNIAPNPRVSMLTR